MGFSRQESWSGLPCPPSEDLPNPGIKPPLKRLCRNQLGSSDFLSTDCPGFLVWRLIVNAVLLSYANKPPLFLLKKKWFFLHHIPASADWLYWVGGLRFWLSNAPPSSAVGGPLLLKAKWHPDCPLALLYSQKSRLCFLPSHRPGPATPAQVPPYKPSELSC